MSETSSSTTRQPSVDVRVRRTPGQRCDERGREYAGSQMCLQVWMNRREGLLSAALLRALGVADPGARVEWMSPLDEPTFMNGLKEYEDGAFLAHFRLRDNRAALKDFWPAGGPVWDGLALVKRRGVPDLFVLLEAKSYQGEVSGRGCAATASSREMIALTGHGGRLARCRALQGRPLGVLDHARRISTTIRGITSSLCQKYSLQVPRESSMEILSSILRSDSLVVGSQRASTDARVRGTSVCR